MKIVHLDFGHGGKDPGATGNGLKEKDVVLAVGLKVGKELERHGVKVTYSRKNDKFVELRERANIANRAKAGVFVSIHCNAFNNASAQGLETFHFAGSANGKKLATSVQNSIMAAKLYNRNRGIKTANFAVLRHTSMPAALVELGFITNSQDASLLKSKQSDFAVAIAKGILNYLGIAYKAPQAPQSPSGKLYRVQVGAYRNKDNADRLVKELKSKGYDAFVKIE